MSAPKMMGGGPVDEDCEKPFHLVEHHMEEDVKPQARRAN
jgi:hypothetical protein